MIHDIFINKIYIISIHEIIRNLINKIKIIYGFLGRKYINMIDWIYNDGDGSYVILFGFVSHKIS